MEATTAIVGAGTRRMMILRAFLAQNVAVGCAFGSFGVSVLPLQQRYGASSGTVTLCLGLTLLALGLASPFIGTLIGRIGLRRTMIAGTIISGVGYSLLGIAPNMLFVLALYALPIGIGLAMFGPFPASVLASNWSSDNPGPALGITNMPLLVAILPIGSILIIGNYGLPTLYLVLAGLHVLILPLLLGVADGPPGVAVSHADSADAPPVEMLSARSLFGHMTFWAMCIGGGYLNSVGIIGISHIVPLVTERGIAGSQAALLLSVMGGAAVIGSLIVGILCSRLGAALTLGLIAVSQAAGWFALLSASAFPVMAVTTLFLGIGGAGVFPAINVLSGALFGQASLPRVIGMFGLFTLPFTFGMSPLAGVLRDASTSYAPVVIVIIASSTTAALMFVVMARSTARKLRRTSATI